MSNSQELVKNTHVVMHVCVGDGDKVGSMRQVHQTIVKVLVYVAVARQVAVVNPDVGGQLDSDGITVVGLNLADLHVAHNDVFLAIDGKANTRQCWII